MITFLTRLFNDEKGGESIEMALVVSTIAVATIASYRSVTSSLDTGLANITTGIEEGTGDGAAG